jgi:hypothetical protein
MNNRSGVYLTPTPGSAETLLPVRPAGRAVSLLSGTFHDMIPANFIAYICTKY